jgi:Ran GTPase-activating protein (RanGAP) involved in mRNA processing and transport
MGLNQKKLNDPDMFIIVQQAIRKKHCKELNLQCNEITSQGASILADALINDTNLEILYLHDNHISDLGVQYLSQSLSTKNFTLKTLDLGSNNITDEGAEYLAEMLKTNQILVHLYLRNNQIGNRGTEALANTLAYPNKILEELVLDQNKMISDGCIEILVNMLVQNRSLKTLRIWGCNLSEIGMTRLRDIVKHKHGFTLSD